MTLSDFALAAARESLFGLGVGVGVGGDGARLVLALAAAAARAYLEAPAAEARRFAQADARVAALRPRAQQETFVTKE